MDPRRILPAFGTLFLCVTSANAQVMCKGVEALIECPSTCYNLCENDDGFRQKNRGACSEAALARPDSDPSQCTATAMGIADGIILLEVSEVEACISEARHLVPPVPTAVANLPERQAVYTAFFSDMPICADSPKALSEMYDCVVSDAASVNSTFSQFDESDEGFQELKLKPANEENFDLYLNTYCRLNAAGLLDAIDAETISLRERTKSLQLALASVSQCRVNYQEWILDRPNICDEFPNVSTCPQAANIFRVAQKRDLDRLTSETTQLTVVVEDVETTLNVISLLALAGSAFSCP